MKKTITSDDKSISGQINIEISNSNYSDYLFIDIETKIHDIYSTAKYKYKCSTVEEMRKIIEDAENDLKKIINDFSISHKSHLLSMFYAIAKAKNYV